MRASSSPPVYVPRRAARSGFEIVRGLRLHLTHWGEPHLATPTRPALVLLHGWMDVGASYQFLVDALHELEGPGRWIVAPDWRGFGRSDAPAADSYWFPDYLGDLDTLLDLIAPEGVVDLLGHSMGGNVAMLYAGLKPQRVRRLVNLEGFGLPRAQAEEAPQRLLQWLQTLRTPPRLRPYASLAAVAERLLANDPRLAPERAAWLAPHWARAAAGGGFELRADPAHKRVNPVLYQVDEVLACWRRITAPLLWVEGELTDTDRWWGSRYSRAEFHARLDVVPRLERQRLAAAGHMLHHDQPEALAALLRRFLHEG
ncbi:MAG: alpha/beta hydrolase [Rubrivivax sp. SCN 71-131]|jgi:pimeloyl-ACP methyl ester carboxylesterase|nr:MAG: alpha/beta hydrolase [Rubrivivax sp. SCN 71-131]